MNQYLLTYNISQDYLAEQLQTKTQRQIAKEIGCTEAWVSKLIKRYGLKNKTDPYINKRFGLLTVMKKVRMDDNYHAIYLCQCDCGILKEILGYSLITDNTTTCGCQSRKKGKYHPNYRGYEEIRGVMWNSLRKGAISRGFSFDVTIQQGWDLFIKQKRKCALTGLDLYFSSKARGNSKFTTASFDRIDSTQGYYIGNVQWVHKRINQLKMAYNEEEFIKLCTLVADYHKKFLAEGNEC